MSTLEAQAKYLSEVIIHRLEQNILKAQSDLDKVKEQFPDNRKGIIDRKTTVLEGRQEDLRRAQGMIQQINEPIEELGMKKTPYKLRQRELAKRILEYNRNYYPLYTSF